MAEIGLLFGYKKGSANQRVAQIFDERGIRRRSRSEAAILSRKLHPETHPVLSGERHPRWEGRRKHELGYILVKTPGHSNCHKNKEVFEHRLVMEQKLGRLLSKSEIVHHLNGIPDDNRLENLIALPPKTHHHSSPLRQQLKVAQARIRELERRLNHDNQLL